MCAKLGAKVLSRIVVIVITAHLHKQVQSFAEMKVSPLSLPYLQFFAICFNDFQEDFFLFSSNFSNIELYTYFHSHIINGKSTL